LREGVEGGGGVGDGGPSAIVVMSCLDDVYTALRGQLSRSLVDRLERDPAPMRLASQRQRNEVEEMLVRRLDYLYSAFDVELQDDDPLYPFTHDQLDAVTLFRARDAIAKFREIHESCVTTGTVSRSAARQPPVPPPGVVPRAIDLDRAWNDALTGTAGLPDTDDGVLDLVAEGLRGVADELGMPLAIHRNPTQLIVEGKTIARRIVELCNGGAQGGHLGNQLDALRTLTKTGAVPVALRNSDFQFKQKTKI